MLNQHKDKTVISVEETRLFGRLPNKSGEKRLSKMNRYLEYQSNKVNKYREEGNIDKVVMIWMVMLKHSMSYHMYLLNSSSRDWYWSRDYESYVQECVKFRNKMRTWKFSNEMTRFYVLKSPDQDRVGKVWDGEELKEGEKLRPIGSPDLPTKAASKSMTDLLVYLEDKKRPNNQHGFRPKLGVHTALMDVIERLKQKGNIVWEFDLLSYFNKVPQAWIFYRLGEINKKIRSVVLSGLWKTNYKYKRLEAEKELKYQFDVSLNGRPKKPYLYRSGLPQGLPISPVLSTMALEWVGIPKSIVMYADDGLFIGEKEEEFKLWMEHIRKWGLEMAENKTRKVEGKFRYLGAEIDIENREITIEGVSKKWDAEDIKKFVETAKQKYGKKKEAWTWDIHEKSMIRRVKIQYLTWWERLNIIIRHTWSGVRTWKDYIMIKGEVYSISESSSKSLEQLAEILSKVKYKKIKGFTEEIFIRNPSPHSTIQNRRHHVEVWNNKDAIEGNSMWNWAYKSTIVKLGSQEKDRWSENYVRE